MRGHDSGIFMEGESVLVPNAVAIEPCSSSPWHVFLSGLYHLEPEQVKDSLWAHFWLCQGWRRKAALTGKREPLGQSKKSRRVRHSIEDPGMSGSGQKLSHLRLPQPLSKYFINILFCTRPSCDHLGSQDISWVCPVLVLVTKRNSKV